MSKAFCVVADFYRLRGFRAVRGENGGLPSTLTVDLTTGQHYRAASDSSFYRTSEVIPKKTV